MRIPSLLAILSLSALTLAAQTTSNQTAEEHVEAARAAAGQDWLPLFEFQCYGPGPGGMRTPPGQNNGKAKAQAKGKAPAKGKAFAKGKGKGRGGRGTPPRDSWHREPQQVFDNLYWLGQSEYTAWALTTSDGIILFDTLFDYSVEDEVAEGMKKLGLDPADIKYAVVSHPHPDHDGGAKFLQTTYDTRIILSPLDWDVLMARNNDTIPRRDMEITDGYELTLGDTTVKLYVTPGHTPGTTSSVFPVFDNGQEHLAALWGGVGLNSDPAVVRQYIESAEHFRDILKEDGADVILSNHTDWDQTKVNLPLLKNRQPGTPNPYVVGNDRVLDYLTVAEQCAESRLAN